MNNNNNYKEPKMGSLLGSHVNPFPVSSFKKLGTVYNIYLHEDIESSEDFIDAITVLNMAEPQDEIMIYLNCHGGSLHAVDTLLYEMAKCKAPIHISASGVIASAATLVLMAGHSFDVSPYTQFLFHAASFGAVGKGKDVVDKVEFTKKQTDRIIKDYYEHFFTEDELEDLINNKRERYMDAEEFVERFENAQKLKMKEMEAQENEEITLTRTELEKKTKKELIDFFLNEEE